MAMLLAEAHSFSIEWQLSTSYLKYLDLLVRASGQITIIILLYYTRKKITGQLWRGIRPIQTSCLKLWWATELVIGIFCWAVRETVRNYLYVSAGPLSLINIWVFTNLLDSLWAEKHTVNIKRVKCHFQVLWLQMVWGSVRYFWLLFFFVLLFLIRNSRVIESGTFHCQMIANRRITLKAPFKSFPRAIFSLDQLFFLQGKTVVE